MIRGVREKEREALPQPREVKAGNSRLHRLGGKVSVRADGSLGAGAESGTGV